MRAQSLAFDLAWQQVTVHAAGPSIAHPLKPQISLSTSCYQAVWPHVEEQTNPADGDLIWGAKSCFCMFLEFTKKKKKWGPLANFLFSQGSGGDNSEEHINMRKFDIKYSPKCGPAYFQTWRPILVFFLLLDGMDAHELRLACSYVGSFSIDFGSEHGMWLLMSDRSWKHITAVQACPITS